MSSDLPSNVIPAPRRVAPVEPDLLASAIFLFGEYVAALEQEAELLEQEEEAPQIDMRVFLDRLAEELGTDVATTLNLYLRLTALRRLLESNPPLARLVFDREHSEGSIHETALIAAARLDLIVRGSGESRRADFDPRQFREAIDEE